MLSRMPILCLYIMTDPFLYVVRVCSFQFMCIVLSAILLSHRYGELQRRLGAGTNTYFERTWLIHFNEVISVNAFPEVEASL